MSVTAGRILCGTAESTAESSPPKGSANAAVADVEVSERLGLDQHLNELMCLLFLDRWLPRLALLVRLPFLPLPLLLKARQACQIQHRAMFPLIIAVSPNIPAFIISNLQSLAKAKRRDTKTTSGSTGV